jgi:hypothetical protein
MVILTGEIVFHFSSFPFPSLGKLLTVEFKGKRITKIQTVFFLYSSLTRYKKKEPSAVRGFPKVRRLLLSGVFINFVQGGSAPAAASH